MSRHLFLLVFAIAIALAAADILVWGTQISSITEIANVCRNTQVHGQTIMDGTPLVCWTGGFFSDVRTVLGSARVVTPLGDGTNAFVGYGNTMLGDNAALSQGINLADGSLYRQNTWTGCDSTGTTSSSSNCDNFTNPNANGAYGLNFLTSSQWMYFFEVQCTARYSFYCFSIATPTPTTTPTTKTPTRMPTTRIPTTRIPTTRIPTTHIPTTRAPTTRMPTTRAPTTSIPTTRIPTTRIPTTHPYHTNAYYTHSHHTHSHHTHSYYTHTHYTYSYHTHPHDTHSHYMRPYHTCPHTRPHHKNAYHTHPHYTHSYHTHTHYTYSYHTRPYHTRPHHKNA